MQVELDDLLGFGEVCDLTGKTKGYIQTYIKRGKFPEPVKTLSCGPLWLKPDIDKWKEELNVRGKQRSTSRNPGRPLK